MVGWLLVAGWLIGLVVGLLVVGWLAVGSWLVDWFGCWFVSIVGWLAVGSWPAQPQYLLAAAGPLPGPQGLTMG